MPERPSAITPDAVERKLAQLSASPALHELDDVIESAGSVLKALESAYLESRSTWPAHRQSRANLSIHQAFEAVNSAILTLIVDHDIEGTVQRLTDALPLMRRAWVLQMLEVL
jgi:hypothetical protein